MRQEREVAWAVPRAGRSPEQIRGEMTALARQLERQWSAHFPVRQGYITLTQALDGPVEGMRLRVLRGDFRAELDLRCGYNRSWGDSHALNILVQSRAHSDRMAAIERRDERITRGLRGLGGGIGLCLFTLIFWPVLGFDQPALALMFGFVVLGLMPLGGWVVGAYTAERLSAAARARVLAASCGDADLQTDFRRWRSLARQLGVQRRMVARGSRGGPFRTEPRALAGAT